jgi:putative tryptophan/tyrosine transport system substrate-binding protein
MKRRDFFLIGLGGIVSFSLAARAQQSSKPVIGFLNAGVPEANANFLAAFRKGLSDVGYDEGRNVTIEYRWAYNENDRLRELVTDLVRRNVAVIATPGGLLNALAAKAGTTTIPIVISVAVDPVRFGLVASLNQPGGNITGVNTMGAELQVKLIGIMSELKPKDARLAMLIDPTSPSAEANRDQAQGAASALGRQIEFLNASTAREIDEAFTSLEQLQISALAIPTYPLFTNRRVHIATLAARKAIATICGYREYAESGGLMSYGTNNTDVFRQVGVYTGRILNGEKPSDLPVLRATTFELVINLQTARTIGVEVPVTLLAQADEIIE